MRAACEHDDDVMMQVKDYKIEKDTFTRLDSLCQSVHRQKTKKNRRSATSQECAVPLFSGNLSLGPTS